MSADTPEFEQFYKGRKVFVTGGTGFVGTHLVRRLIGVGADITLLVRKTSSADKKQEFLNAGVKLIEGDLRDRELFMRELKGISHVFHIGALYREAKFSDEIFFEINREGTRNILDSALENKVDRVLYCSTSGVHSHIEHPPANEDAPFHPSDAYQVSKAEAELLVQKYVVEKGLRATIIRPAMIWGEEDTRFLKMFRGIAQRKLPMIGSGETWTHWIYVHDLVNAFLLAGIREQAIGKVYLIAGDRPVPLKYVFETISKIAGVPLFPFSIPVWPVQIIGTIVETICKPFGIEPPIYRRRADFFVKNRAFRTDRAQKDLGYAPGSTFEDEAGRIYRFYKNAGWL
jgi:nucleoside-diphosphate-sugar epimerase